jgi:hypothetical protein
VVWLLLMIGVERMGHAVEGREPLGLGLGLGGNRIGPVIWIHFSEETSAALDPLCWIAANPQRGKLATDEDL